MADGMSQVRKTLLTVLGAAALAAAAAPAGAATTINADWDASCGRSTCFVDGTYKHTWSASDAPGPITIGRLLLDRAILGELDGRVFRLSFQIDGQEVGTWGKFMMSEIGGDELNFWGENFTWNPADGDLTLVLEIDWDAARGGGFGRRAPASAGDGGGDGSAGGGDGGSGGDPGLPGGGDDPPTVPSSVAPVPEPGAWALMITGFGMAGAVARRRRALRLRA